MISSLARGTCSGLTSARRPCGLRAGHFGGCSPVRARRGHPVQHGPETHTALLACEGACGRPTWHAFRDHGAGLLPEPAVSLWFACMACHALRVWGLEDPRGAGDAA